MDKKYYEVAVKVRDEIYKDQKKYTQDQKRTSVTIVGFKKKNIPTWYMIYLSALCNILKMDDMKDFIPTTSIDGCTIIYASSYPEAKNLTGGDTAFLNYYFVQEEQFIHSILQDHYKDRRNGLVIVSYREMYWIVDTTALSLAKQAENQETSLLTKAVE